MVRTALCLVVLVWAAALCVIDLRERRLPNALTLSGAAVILLFCAACGRGWPALLGASALGGLYLAVHLADPSAMGGGDVKLAVALGGLTGALGAPVWVLGALGAALLTALCGTVAILRGRRGALPHGPSMCVASLIAALPAVF